MRVPFKNRLWLHRLARGGDAVLRYPVDRADGRASSRHRLRAVRGVRAIQLGARTARARGWIGVWLDGAPGTADDVLTGTGETLAQFQDRVLGAGASVVALQAIPGYATGGIRSRRREGRTADRSVNRIRPLVSILFPDRARARRTDGQQTRDLKDSLDSQLAELALRRGYTQSARKRVRQSPTACLRNRGQRVSRYPNPGLCSFSDLEPRGWHRVGAADCAASGRSHRPRRFVTSNRLTFG